MGAFAAGEAAETVAATAVRPGWAGRPGAGGGVAFPAALPAAVRSAEAAAEEDDADGGANLSRLIVPCGLPTGETLELAEAPPP